MDNSFNQLQALEKELSRLKDELQVGSLYSNIWSQPSVSSVLFTSLCWAYVHSKNLH